VAVSKAHGTLQEYRLGAPTKYAALAEKAATLAESADDWHKARACWDIKTRWHLLEKDRERNLLLRCLPPKPMSRKLRMLSRERLQTI